jgi:hypothetical protein
MKHTGRLVGLVIAVVVVVGAGIGSYFVFFRDSGPPPDQVVAGFVRSYTAIDRNPTQANLTTFYGYLCDTDRKSAEALYGVMVATHDPGDPDVTFSESDLRVTGDQGTFTLKSTEAGKEFVGLVGHVEKQDGKWLVCRTLAGH